MLIKQIFHLLLPDAMFTRARSLHRERALHQAVQKHAAGFNILRIVHVAQQGQVKIAVTHMADNRRNNAGRFDILLRGHHTLVAMTLQPGRSASADQ